VGVEQLDQRRPVYQHLPLVHVSLTGDLAVIQAGGAGHHRERLDADRRADQENEPRRQHTGQEGTKVP
jgi:hypothetical protein